MEFFQHLWELDPATWEVLAAVVVVLTAAVAFIRWLVRRGQGSTSGIARHQSQNSQSQTNQQHVTVKVAPTFTFPNQSHASGQGSRRGSTSGVEPKANGPAIPATNHSPLSESSGSADGIKATHSVEQATAGPQMVQRAQPAIAPERPHLGPDIPTHVSEGEPERGVEAAPPSAKLAPQYVQQRKNLRQALWCASCIVQELKTYVSSSKRTSQSEQPYKNHVRLHGALKDYLEKTARAIADLNTALNKVTDVTWPSGDPRHIFFSHLDPLGGPDGPDAVRSNFEDMLDSMLGKVRSLGYEIVQREVSTDKPYLHERLVWHLTKARNLQLEAFDVADDELGDEEGEPDGG